ncbi:MAG: glutathione S-transferase family protein [Pseudomonadota bacterium]
MTPHLWTVSGAPSPWRVALAMAFKGLDYEVQMLSASEREHKSEPYLSLNPRGTVPTLQADDLTLRHSIAILAWLDRTFPGKPLFGETPEEAGNIWQSTMDIFDHLPDATSAVLSPIFFDNAAEATDALREAAERLRSETDRLALMLAGQAWLSGSRPGAADAVAFPHIRLIQRAMETKPQIMTDLGLPSLAALSPEIAAWVARVEALPNVSNTFPPHWAEAA